MRSHLKFIIAFFVASAALFVVQAYAVWQDAPALPSQYGSSPCPDLDSNLATYEPCRQEDYKPVNLGDAGQQKSGNLVLGTTTAPLTTARLYLSMPNTGGLEGLHITRSSDTPSSWSYLNIEDQNSNPIFKVHENGNVGIGTTGPGARLHVADPGTGAYTARFGTGAVSQFANVDVISNSGTNAFQVWDDNVLTVPRFIVQRGGNVGIGTMSPDSTLTVYGSTSLHANGVSPGLRIHNETPGAGDYLIRVDTTSSNTDRFVVKGDGNVGIGTTTPAYKLDVAGIANATKLCIAGDCKASWSAAVGAPPNLQQVTDVGTTTSNSISAAAFYDYDNPAYFIDPFGATAGKLRGNLIVESGNVGIGTPPLPSHKLHLRSGVFGLDDYGYISSLRQLANNYTNLFLGGAIYDNNNGTYTIKGDGGSNYWAAIRMDNEGGNAGSIRFYSRPSISGADYTLTNAQLQTYAVMNLIGGNVGIGTANPDTDRLRVAGGDVRVGELNPAGTGAFPDYGRRLYFSGGPSSAFYDSDNSDALWMARYNTASDDTQLRVNLGDDDNTLFVVGGWNKCCGLPDVNALAVRSDGAVGIGTTGPNRRLTIQSSGTRSTNSQYLYLRQPDDYGYSFNLDDLTTGRMYIRGVNNGVESDIMTFDRSNGNVGIGTATPNAKLEVDGDILVGSSNWYRGLNAAAVQQPLIRSRGMGYSSVTYPGVQVGQTGDHIALFIDPLSIYQPGSQFSGNTNEIMVPNYMDFHQANSAGTDWLRYVLTLNNGNVGIGTASPGAYKLNVAGPLKAAGDLVVTGAGQVGGTLTIGTSGNTAISDTGNSYFNSKVGIGTKIPSIQLALGDSDTGFKQAGDGVLTMLTNNVERMRIDFSGNVGIGMADPPTIGTTTLPLAKLSMRILGDNTFNQSECTGSGFMNVDNVNIPNNSITRLWLQSTHDSNMDRKLAILKIVKMTNSWESKWLIEQEDKGLMPCLFDNQGTINATIGGGWCTDAWLPQFRVSGNNLQWARTAGCTRVTGALISQERFVRWWDGGAYPVADTQ